MSYSQLKRTNSYQNKNSFFKKLLYEIDRKKVINIIAEELTAILFGQSRYNVTVSEKDNGIYFQYPNLGIKSNEGYQILLENFHLTFHTQVIVQTTYHDKIHFSFVIGSIKYIYPLIQTDNSLSKKPLNPFKTYVGGSIIYTGFNDDINQIIEITLNTIKKNLDFVEKKMEENIINQLQQKKYNQEQELARIAQEYQQSIIEDNAQYEIQRDEFYRRIENEVGPPSPINNTNRPKKISRSSWGRGAFKINIKNNKGIGLLNQPNSMNNSRKRKRNNKNGGSKQKNKLKFIKTKYLREYCKKNKLKGYSEYNKKDLINFIKNNVTKKLT